MTEADLGKIESALGQRLPSHYREFILLHGEELKRIKTALPLRAVIHDEPNEIIGDNEFARKSSSDVFMIGEDGQPWPENYFLVGTNGGGDYWYIHRDGSDVGLWFWSHESCEIHQCNQTLGDYLTELRFEMQFPERWQ